MAVRLSRINTALVIVIILVNCFVLATPLWPAFVYQKEKHSGKAQAIAKQVENPAKNPDTAMGNRLLVPAMVLDTQIYDGKSTATLNQGLWRLPHSSTPDQGSNTVIVAHRFTYTNPHGTFYHLDKVKPGDRIGVVWSSKQYTYVVNKTERVPATAIAVEAPTKEPTLTLYTCTPLWNPKDRLVVRATLQEEQP